MTTDDRPARPTPPDSSELFSMLRAYLHRAGTDRLILRDGLSELYLAVDTDIERLAVSVGEVAQWQRREGRAPDVMADSGEVVIDFLPIYPPDFNPKAR